MKTVNVSSLKNNPGEALRMARIVVIDASLLIGLAIVDDLKWLSAI